MPLSLPLYCAHAAGGPSAIHAADGRLLAMVTQQPGDDTSLAETFAIAPEALRDLAALVFAICCLDDEYCATHGVQRPPDGAALAAALTDAIACIRTARDLGVIIPEVTQ